MDTHAVTTSKHYKYPRTPHLPFSPGLQSDDTRLDSLERLIGREVVVTEKMDGENTSMYRDHIHARSLDSRHHPSRDWVKNFWSAIRYDIPEGWRICGENLYARHSVEYGALSSYFMGFSVWNDSNVCLSWKETLEYFALLGIQPVPVLHQAVFDQATLEEIAENFDTANKEGFVVRPAAEFTYSEFPSCVAKWVRRGHVQTDQNWMHGLVHPNQLIVEPSPGE